MSDDLSTGIVTDFVDDPMPGEHGFRVTWIHWDSAFRATDLRIGDIIHGVDGTAYDAEMDSVGRSRGIGQYAESQYWAGREATHGQTIDLMVLRDGTAQTATAPLDKFRFYYDANERRALGPGGPDRSKSDGFQGAWSGWYETFWKNASRVLDDGWTRSGFNNMKELDRHREDRARVDYCVEHYPGPFANALLDDWQRVQDALEGRIVPLGEADLAYRTLTARRQALVGDAAKAAYKACLDSLGDGIIETFPTIDPVEGDRTQVAGKLVVLPALGPRQMINDLGSAYAVAGSRREGFYFVDLESPDSRRFFDAVLNYQTRVSPNFVERYEYVGRIEEEPALLTVDGRPEAGLVVEIVAGSADRGAFFCDLTAAPQDGPPAFAGEELLAGLNPVDLPDGAGPGEVVAAMIEAIKVGNERAWRRCFAHWRVLNDFFGPCAVDADYRVRAATYQRAFQDSRRLIEGDVYDARVAKVTRPRVILDADPDLAIPRVEQAIVTVDHIGLFEEVYRVFTSVKVHRTWELQRLGEGPWRIADVRCL